MRLARTWMYAIVAALQAATTAALSATLESEIIVKPLGPDQYELTFTSAIPDFLIAKQALLPKATEICGNKPPTFGHYSFEMKQPVTDSPVNSPSLLRLTQAVQCGAATTTPVFPTFTVPDGWQPTANDRATVERETYRYLDSKAAGNYEIAYAMFSDSMKGATHFDSWQASEQSFNAKSGRVLDRKVRKITWYKDPPSAPIPGIYVALDYSSVFADVPIHCGYVAWYRTPGGAYRIIREEQNSISKASIAMMKPAEVAALAARFGCVGQ
jgi:Protein of unknown function (DUF4019)